MKPTKEEILKKHHKNARGHWVALTSNRALKAMQEYAEEYHKEKLREELIAYDEWYYSQSTFTVTDGPSEKLIDEYLKTKP